MWSPAAPHPEPQPGSEPAPGDSPFGRHAEAPTGQWPFATPTSPIATQPVRARSGRPGAGVRRVAGAAGLAVVVAAAATGGAWAGATVLAPRAAPATITPAAATTTGNGSTANNGVSSLVPVAPVSVNAPTVAQTVVPSVVYIEVSAAGSRFQQGFPGAGQFGDGQSQNGDGQAQGGQVQPVASGSGVVLDKDGHVVTNRHVVEAGTSYRVILSDGRSYAAKLLGEDAATDLAVLKISADDLTPIVLGSSDVLKIGGTTIAVGSPLGLQGGPSLSVGVLSAIGREVQTDQQTILYGMLQTDAAINEGSSGGALVDEQGHLVGITTAVGVSSVGIEGVGFATPVEIVKRVADELIAHGAATTAGLGISGATAYRDLSDGGQAPTGVEIGQVQTGSAADKAGLKDGDVITHVDGVAVDTMDELVSILRRHSAGDQVTLTVQRTGGEQTVTVVLGSLSS
jgi:S1-C subfamily serine protease